MKPRHLLIAALACLPTLGMAVEKQILLQSTTSWDGTPYQAYPQGKPELTLLKLRIPANTVLDWHSHAMPNAGYLLSGELIVETRDTGKTVTVRPGDAMAELIGTQHRGRTGALPAELIVFYAGSPGMPLAQ